MNRRSTRQSSAGASVCVLLLALTAGAASCAAGDQVARLNAAFLDHIRSLKPAKAEQVAFVERAWASRGADEPADSFVPDALAVLYPAFRDALAAFDDGRFADATKLADPLRKDADPYLAANAAYYHARGLIERGLLEEAESALHDATADAAPLEQRTPYAAHLWYLRGFCEASNLHFDAALESLKRVQSTFPDAPEAVTVGARQLKLEIDRREVGTLDEIATLMTYAGTRLKVADATERVQKRQTEAIEKLDKLIEEMEKQEQQQQGGGQSKKSGSGQKQGQAQTPTAPREQSDAPTGGNEGMDLHAAPRATPGEMWGKLPPAEREKILQSLRERFPSRYRQLVEQYYRSLADGAAEK